MKKIHWGVVLAGVAVGLAALILTAMGNPANMGFCIACFLRDTAGACGLHSAAKVQYVRPEIIGLVLGAFLMSVAGKEFKARAGSSRLLIWRSLLPLIAERPLLGGGCGTLYLRDVPPFYWQRGGETTYFAVTSAHNEYLGVLVDQGALALLAFLALLALALWRAYRHAESDRCAVAGAALLCYAVTAFFSVACCITGVYLWLLLAMLAPKEK